MARAIHGRVYKRPAAHQDTVVYRIDAFEHVISGAIRSVT